MTAGAVVPPDRWRRESPAIAGRELLAYLVAGVLTAVVMSWPLARHLRSRVAQDLIDPLNQAWQLAWGGHALRTDPLSVWQANTHFPLPDTLAFSDSLLGYAPLSALLRGTTGAVVAYNLAFLIAYAMCFVGAALLARELGARPSAAAVAGIAFAYAPWRMTHNGHLNILSVGGVAIALFLLLRGYRRASPALVVSGWLVCAWQLSIGFAMGLFFAYLLLVLAVAAVLLWLAAGRPAVARPVITASATGIVLFLVAAALLARPYLRVTERYPEAKRTIESVEYFTPVPKSLLAAPAESRVWGERTRDIRDTLRFPGEQALFPGVVVVGLAGLGVVIGGLRLRTRLLLLAGVVASTVLALGTSVRLTRPLYLLLFDHAPGWDAVRTPGRIFAFASLGLALLAAVGTHALQDVLLAPRIGRRVAEDASRRHVVPSPIAVGAVLAALVFAEGMPRLPQQDVPRRPVALDTVAVPRVHLPTDYANDTAYMLFSAADFTPIANGSTSFLPPRLERLRAELVGFPDAASVAVLRELGVRAVVLHLDRAPGTPWADAAIRPIAGLPLEREDRGDLVVYRLTQ